MKIVIDIDEKDYRSVKEQCGFSTATFQGALFQAIANGIPLDEIRAEIETQREEASNKHSEDSELQAYYNGLNDGLKDARDTLDEYMTEDEVD